jgi:Flp pilus assembly protein protease CpaA
MIVVYLTISFIFLNVIFPIILFLDLKYRRIPLKFFNLCFLITVFSNIIEYYFSNIHILSFIYGKILIGLFVCFLSLVLFSLKIIGGGDGKLIILIFLIHPLLFLDFNLILTYFLIFSLLFVIFFLIKLIDNNKIKNRFSFFLFFNSCSEFSYVKKSFIKSFYKFLNFSDLDEYVTDNFVLKSSFLIYNAESNKFQILSQNRPPLMILVIIAYYIFYISLRI